MILRNYADSKCTWGYMTLCRDCVKDAPSHVDTVEHIKQVLPGNKCDMCKRKGIIPVDLMRN